MQTQVKEWFCVKKEGTQELRSYADVTKGKYWEDDRAIDAHIFLFLYLSRFIVAGNRWYPARLHPLPQ